VTFHGGVFIVAALPTPLLLLALHGSMSKPMASKTLVYVEMWHILLCFEPHSINEEAEPDTFICCFFVLCEHNEGFMGREFVIFTIKVNGFIWDTVDNNAVLGFMW